MKSVKLDNLNLSVDSIKESEFFYKELFGLSRKEEGQRPDGRTWAILSNGEFSLCINEDKRRHPDENKNFHRLNHLSIRMNKIDFEEFKEKKKRLKIPDSYPSPVHYPYSESWYISDPSGHEIEVVNWNDKVKFPK